MKGEVSRPMVVGVIVVVVLVIAGIGWQLFGPKQVSSSDNPQANAARENMAKMREHPTPPPGALHGREMYQRH